MMAMMMGKMRMLIIITDDKYNNNGGFTIRAVRKTEEDRRGRGEGSSDEI